MNIKNEMDRIIAVNHNLLILTSSDKSVKLIMPTRPVATPHQLAIEDLSIKVRYDKKDLLTDIIIPTARVMYVFRYIVPANLPG